MTAVIVAHDGAGWLAHGIDALLAQTKQVQRIVAVDTGSRDRSGSVLAGKIGQGAVFGMDRSTGYAAAVRRALQHKAASAPLPVPAGSQARGRPDLVEWIWLLHDDCEPAPDALEQLLRGAAETPTAAVLGPKLMDWTDRDVVLETGISLDNVGRRTTGIEPREVDQGQHDGDRDVLAVSSAGMLVRRDVWEQVGGFDPGMALFGEDIDLCWRVHASGFRVRVVTDAVVYHALAATRGRRAISVGRRARLLDRRNGLLTLLGNLPTGPMLAALVANLAISLVRTVFYAVAKRGTAALDEAAAVIAVVGHPLRFATARRRRARGRRAAYSRVRADLPAGHSIRRAAEFIALVVSRSGKTEASGGQSAIDDPDEDDSLLTDSGFLQRFITRPGVLLMVGLLLVTIVAEHALIGAGPLGGGALIPAWEGASQLWGEVLQAFHPVGVGSASAAPPSAGFVALLATFLLGKPWLAVSLLLLGCVPLAGLTAFLAMRPVTRSAPVRVWVAASYALLPVAFGAVAAGRLGSAVVFVLIPLIGLSAGRIFTESPRLARRAAWAVGLTVTVGTAFVPVLWPMAVVAAVLAALALPRTRDMLLNLLIVALTPLVLLLPWMLEQLSHPSSLLLESGVQQPGLATVGLPARSLLLLSPGGPGLPPYWVSGALLLTALVSLFATRRRKLVVVGWTVALLGLATAILMSRMTVTPAGGQAMTPWPGPALAVTAAGLLLAAAAGADGVRRSMNARGRSGLRLLSGTRGVAMALLGIAAVSAPALAAGYWILNGVSGPVAPASGGYVPALVPITGGAGRQLRTLVLSSSGGKVSYLLLRGDSPDFTNPGVVPVGAAQAALSQTVASLVAPGGDEAANQSQQLANFDIGFVLLRAPVNPQLASVIGSVSGLTSMSITSSFDLWKLTTLPSRVSVVEPSGAVVPVSSGPIGVSGASAPASGGILELAEPAGGWHAALNGQALTPVPSPAGSWAQAFRLPAGGGTITVGRSGLLHDLITALELLAIVAVAVLALPGVRTAAEIEAAAAASAKLAQEAAEAEAQEESSAAVPAAAASAGGLGGRAGRSRSAGRKGSAGRTGSAGRGRSAGRKAGASRQGGAGRSRGAEQTGRGRSRRAAGLPAPDATGTDGAGRQGRAGAGAPGAIRDGGGRPGRAGVPGADRDGAGRSGRAGAPVPDAAGVDGAGRRRGAVGAIGSAAAAGAAGAAAAAAAGRAAAGRAAAGRAALGGVAAGRAAAGRAAAGGVVAGRVASGRAGAGEADAGGADWPSSPGSAGAGDPMDDYYSQQPAPGQGRSPSGSGFDEPPARRRPAGGYDDQAGEHWQQYPPQPVHGRSPSGAPYRDEPAYQDRPPYESTPYESGQYESRPYESGPYGGNTARRQSYEPAPEWQDSGWHTSPQSGWPQQSAAQQGWPQGQQQQQGWPREYGSEPDRGWDVPEQGDALEALPPPGEVHHDWPARDERSRRGWLAPEDDTNGDAW